MLAHGRHLRRNQYLREHVQSKMYETSMKKNGGNKAKEYERYLAANQIHCLPKPLVRMLRVREPAETTNLTYGTQSVRWVCRIVETFQKYVREGQGL